MEIQFEAILLTVLWLSLVNIVAATENAVLLKVTDFQKITSSTLRWAPITSQGSIPEDVVVGSKEYTPIGVSENDLSQMNVTDRSQIRETKIYVCRAFVNGNWAPGALFENTNVCIVPMVVKVLEIERYDVLQNIDQAARLIWTPWERHEAIPTGAVAAGEYYIAHSPSDKLKVLSETVAIGMTHRMGRIDPEEGLFGKLSVVDEDKNLISEVSRGRVLVEHEPVLYELTITKLMEKRKKVLRREQRMLGDVNLSNDDSREMKAESVITYTWKYESWWGQGRAMLKGRPTTIYFANATQVENITWGIPYIEEKDEVEKVETLLGAGTSVHVTVEASYQEIELPYTGTLLSVFADTHTMNRTIQGIWRYTTLTDIRSIYGPLYFIQNGSLVPTTTTTTTTEAPTTMPVPTTTVATEPPTITTQKFGEDERNTRLPVKDEHSNMLNDDSDAMQLKKKEDGTPLGGSAASIFTTSINSMNLLICMGLLVRLLFGHIVQPIT